MFFPDFFCTTLLAFLNIFQTLPLLLCKFCALFLLVAFRFLFRKPLSLLEFCNILRHVRQIFLPSIFLFFSHTFKVFRRFLFAPAKFLWKRRKTSGDYRENYRGTIGDYRGPPATIGETIGELSGPVGGHRRKSLRGRPWRM